MHNLPGTPLAQLGPTVTGIFHLWSLERYLVLVKKGGGVLSSTQAAVKLQSHVLLKRLFPENPYEDIKRRRSKSFW